MPAHRLEPTSAEELAAALAGAYGDAKTIEIAGHGSKRRLGGPRADADVELNTAKLNSVLAYEPADLTISVQAGMPWAELGRLLAENNQMIPLDPPFANQATVGGALASDSSGPRRRRYGTARDMVIGMQFATAEGKLVNSGGMVVKNVTGLDMAKLMIGSYGTLAAITTANFKLFPRPVAETTFVFRNASAAKLVALRQEMLAGVAQPFALDLLNAGAAQALGLEIDAPFALLAKTEGSHAVVARYRSEYEALASRAGVEMTEPEPSGADALWAAIREFPSTALEASPDAALLRVATTASKLTQAVETAPNDAWLLSRAANAIVYLAFTSAEQARQTARALRSAGFGVLAESLPANSDLERWSPDDAALAAMTRLKNAFDPERRLNPGRLFGRL
ncbi:MAG: FAD-binding oxidoreductase [Bryobacterales bacterium]